MEMFWGGLLVFVARVVNVSMATVRSLLSMRGQRRLATVISFFESLIFEQLLGLCPHGPWKRCHKGQGPFLFASVLLSFLSHRTFTPV